MKTRLITAFFGLVFLIPIVVFSHTVVLPIAAGIFSVLATQELFSCLGVGKKWYYLALALPYAFAVPFLVQFFYKSAEQYFQLIFLFSCLLVAAMFSTLVLCHGREQFSTLAQSLLMVIYVTVGFTSLVLLRQHKVEGLCHFAFPFLIAWITDGFAYFTGVFFGKHKLCLNISPKKTIEGAVGGVVLGSGFCLGLAFVMANVTSLVPNYGYLAVCCLLASVLSQIGDLLASVIKREYKIKDFGKVLPGHGGILDRFDSIIFVSPILLFLSNIGGMPLFFA